MRTLIEIVEKILYQATYDAFDAFAELPFEGFKVDVTLVTQEKFGHYQCNSALKLAKIIKKSPHEVAQAIINKISDQIFESVEIAGPGFINIKLSSQFLSKSADQMVRDPRLGIPLPEKKQRIIVEFSSPNIAKEMHVGHLRSTIIGDSIARLFEFLGHDVIRLNHVGDWGTAFGMLIAYMQEKCPEVLTGKQRTDLSSLMQWYRASKIRFDEDSNFKSRARYSVVALQRGDKEAICAWEMICEISRKAFQQVYDLLDIELQERGESYYNSMLPSLVADLEDKGLITVSEGAKCVFHEGMRIPLMVQKSDSGYNYDTTDMAAMLHRIREEKADRIVIVTDAGQSLHFELVRKTAEKAGYLDPKKVRFDHIPFGVVLGADGKKFRTRSGETEKLIDLIEAAIHEARNILCKRENDMNDASIDQLAHILGIDALKYADLSCNRTSDYVFSYERMLRFEGNTAAFILYSYVRVSGIKRRVGLLNFEDILKKEQINLLQPAELSLGFHLCRFSEILKLMENDLMPHYLTDYLYLLAQKFNIFFRDCRVEGVPEQNQRLLLCELAAHIMERGFQLLGIKSVERM